jgi:hypothetical protein
MKTHIYIHIYVCIYSEVLKTKWIKKVAGFTYTHLSTYINIYTHIYIYIYIYTFRYIYTHLHIYTYSEVLKTKWIKKVAGFFQCTQDGIFGQLDW